MRVYLALLASATILLGNTDRVALASQFKLTGVNRADSAKTVEATSDNKRFLLGKHTSENTEERWAISNNISGNLRRWAKANRQQQSNAIPITPQNIDEILEIQKLDAALNPEKAEKLVAAGFLGWLGKADLDQAMSRNMDVKKAVFAKWRNDHVKATTITELLGRDPAIKKKYSFIPVAYKGYLESK
ncbi:RxLR effector protein, partial [Phytophthora megakarya]